MRIQGDTEASAADAAGPIGILGRLEAVVVAADPLAGKTEAVAGSVALVDSLFVVPGVAGPRLNDSRGNRLSKLETSVPLDQASSA